MENVSVLIHAVWGTKYRAALLTSEIRSLLFAHMKENAAKRNIRIVIINGMPDHVHCLFYLNPEFSVEKTMGLIKGESSFWLNKEKLIIKPFKWARGYYARYVGVGEKQIVIKYIENQQIHHQEENYFKASEDFLKTCKFD
ncbi:MAG: IS200/IS605 family transposase [Saprospiraceae bacterium]